MVTREVVSSSSASEEYRRQLMVNKQSWKLSTGNTYVVADCNKLGALEKGKYCVLQSNISFTSVDNQQKAVIVTCSCQDGAVQSKQLTSMVKVVAGEFTEFVATVKAKFCTHADAVDKLWDVTANANLTDNSEPVVVDILDRENVLAAVTMESCVHLIHLKTRQWEKKLACMTCRYGTTECDYVENFRTWCDETGEITVAETVAEEPRTSQFKYFSYKPIPYPKTLEMASQYAEHQCGKYEFPEFLIPVIPVNIGDINHTCKHGCEWNADDPVHNNWVIGNGTIYKEVCFRPSAGPCDCCLYYDGQEDLLFNLNNKDFIHYSLLYPYLNLMIQARNPLAAFHKAYADNLETMAYLPLHKFRLAWNGFARLLNICWNSAFSCTVCGDKPDVIICDGTAVGMNKQLLKCFASRGSDTSSLPPIYGSKHKDRVFIPSPQARKLLMQFAGLHIEHKHYRQLPVNPLSEEEYRRLINLLRKHQHLLPLADVIERIGEDRIAPVAYQSFLQDLSKNSPASSLLQTEEHSTVRHIIKEIAILAINVFLSCHQDKLEILQRDAPIISNFIENVSVDGCLHLDVRHLLRSLLQRCKFNHQEDTNQHYLPPAQQTLFTDLSFFPNLPEVQCKGNYIIDSNAETRGCRGPDTCNKFSNGHPTLSPGLFTIHCPHKICIGFHVMEVHESPAIPFQILMTRLTKAPRMFIYNNACKLHQYCLNREPEYFKNTMFLVDRLHWNNHTGCSSGYNMDTYRSNGYIAGLNSQVSEQSNAAINRIKAQLSYMLPDNFIFHTALFLGITNMKIKKSTLQRC